MGFANGNLRGSFVDLGRRNTVTASLYVTGTDTGVGKTIASVALLRALQTRGKKAIGMKPVASGCVLTEQGWRNQDALMLLAASDPTPDYALLNPFPLPEATAPQIAAAKAGVVVSLSPILAAHRQLGATADVVVVEGVGGWLAPLSAALEQGQLVRALQASVVLVVGLKLGCLSHARLSARAIDADGLPLQGWIGNAVDPELMHSADYVKALQDALSLPCWGILPYLPKATAEGLAAHLSLPIWP